ncbi:DUF6868 family protein [Paraferrimonas sp. SM1919]|uniref:DUF6868 family protein n=1 Tax=Paraferrimonas sp. SM1919 TaxID=2662263 RepID=UPI0013D195BD|nr:hypothetical protein [Paraferrimonas sp. SM1919]
MENLITVLGWCTVINVAIYLFVALAVYGFNDAIKGLHSRITRVPVEQLDTLYFNYIANYKLLITVFNLVPYIALNLAR